MELYGITYKDDTKPEVIKQLCWARANETRIRLFYGDKTTGRDWLEENDTMGYIGNSSGKIKIPILVHNKRSWGGSGLLDNCIVKITTARGGRVLYQHPTYHQAELTIKPDSTYPEYKYAVYANDELHARFENFEKAEKYVEFLKGNRNSQ